MSDKLLGKKGEAVAARYYLNQGYTLLEHNYQCRLGELDLILQKQQAFQLLRILLFQVLLTTQVAISDWNLSADALQSSLCLSNSTLAGKKFCDRALFLIIRDCLLCRSLLPSQITD